MLNTAEELPKEYIGHPIYDHGAEPMPAMTAAPMREVPHSMVMLTDANDRLTKAIEVLHERTASVRASFNKEQEDRATRDFASPVAQDIAAQAYRTDLAAQVIEKILRELEI